MFCLYRSTQKRFYAIPKKDAITTNGEIVVSRSATNNGSAWRSMCSRWGAIIDVESYRSFWTVYKQFITMSQFVITICLFLTLNRKN